MLQQSEEKLWDITLIQRDWWVNEGRPDEVARKAGQQQQTQKHGDMKVKLLIV